MEDFPDSSEFSSSVEFGEAVYSAITKRFKRDRGGKITETFENESKAFGHVWAFAHTEDKLVVTEEDIDFFTETRTDAEKDFIFENNAKRVIGLMSGKGYLPIQTSFIFEDLSWAEYNEFLIKTDLVPDIGEVRSAILDGYILPRGALLEYSEELVKDYITESGHDVRTRFEDQHIALTTTIETKLERRGWVKLNVTSPSDRVWVEAEGIFSDIIPDAEDVGRIPEEHLENIIEGYLHKTLNIGRYVSGNLHYRVLARAFEKKLRGQGWGEIVHRGSSTWYTTKDSHREALERLDEEYRSVLEVPNPGFGSLEEMKKSRTAAYEFYNENSIQLRKFGIVDETEFDHKLGLLKAYRDAADEWERLDGADTAGGKWILQFDDYED